MKRSIICPHKFFTGGLSPTRGKLRNWSKTAKKIKVLPKKTWIKINFVEKIEKYKKLKFRKILFFFSTRRRKSEKPKKAMTLSNFWTKEQKSEICKIPTKILVNQPWSKKHRKRPKYGQSKRSKCLIQVHRSPRRLRWVRWTPSSSCWSSCSHSAAASTR